MKVLIVDTYYSGFFRDFSRRQGAIAGSFSEQRRRLLDAYFGTGDSYSRALKARGVEAEELIVNSAPLQLAWAREHRFSIGPPWRHLPPRWASHELVNKVITRARVLSPIVLEQVRRTRPDVLYLQDLSFISPEDLGALKPHVRLIVGQIACPLPSSEYLKPYDLILTSFPHYVSRLQARGIASEYFRLGFDPIVREKLGVVPKRYACSFVGGISKAHTRGTAFLEHLAAEVDIDFFGYGKHALSETSNIRARHHGEVWALDMHRTLAESYITVNRHVDVAENFANNMRLYEATGAGAMLLTDAKDNLGEIFEVGREVVAYRDTKEAVEMIRFYSAHPEERDAIARAGLARTLRDHTYERRMEQLVEILTRHLDAQSSSAPSTKAAR